MKTFMTVVAALGIVQAHAQNTLQFASELGAVSPHSFSLTRGSILAGGIRDLYYSDNFAMVVRSDFGGGMPAQIMFQGRLPIDPSGLSITIESHATSPNIQQIVAMWDWNARNWVTLGSDTLGAWDAQREYTLPGNVLRFSEAGTGRMQAAIGYRAIGPTYGPLWQVRLDTAFWTYSR